MKLNGKSLLDGQAAVVTGAGQGMGRAIALALAKAGARVVTADVNLAAAESTAKEIQQQDGTAWPLAWDVANPEDATRVASEVKEIAGDIAILINNAGVHRIAPLGAPDQLQKWRDIMSVNLDGILFGTTAFLEQLKRTRGCIVNMASIQSFVAQPNETTAYSTSKGGVLMMTKALAVDLARYGIRVNAVAPGLTETPATVASLQNVERMTFYLTHTPMKRVGKPEEIAGPVVFLASPLASYVTGTILPVDGGFLAL
jgi:NAD(P)-dependent dehydrogenase (short-subunit alcohol dehydrogenase family)